MRGGKVNVSRRTQGGTNLCARALNGRTCEKVEQPVCTGEKVDQRPEAAAEDDVEDRQAGLETWSIKERLRLRVSREPRRSFRSKVGRLTHSIDRRFPRRVETAKDRGQGLFLGCGIDEPGRGVEGAVQGADARDGDKELEGRTKDGVSAGCSRDHDGRKRLEMRTDREGDASCWTEQDGAKVLWDHDGTDER